MNSTLPNTSLQGTRCKRRAPELGRWHNPTVKVDDKRALSVLQKISGNQAFPADNVLHHLGELAEEPINWTGLDDQEAIELGLIRK